MRPRLRSVNTKFWDDPWTQELSISERLLFLYLLTNPLTNLIGVYEISKRRILFDTGLTSDQLEKALKRFEKDSKCFYDEDSNHIILPNFLKNQSLNANMKVGALNCFEELPNGLKDRIISNGSKSFESLLNGLVKVKGKGKVNNESEGEVEEPEKTILHPTNRKEVLTYAIEYINTSPAFGYKVRNIQGLDAICERIVDYYTEGGLNDKWKRKNGRIVSNWKQAVRTWLSKEPDKIEALK